MVEGKRADRITGDLTEITVGRLTAREHRRCLQALTRNGAIYFVSVMAILVALAMPPLDSYRSPPL